MRIPHAAHKHSVTFSEQLKGDLFILPAKERQPKWLSLFSTAVSDLPTIITKNASALLIVPTTEATYALNFGYGRKLLAPGSWEEDFGLKVTLNSVDKQRIRSVDRTSFDSIGQHGRIQASREADISEFGLDLEQDMIRAVTGKPNDQTLGRHLTGKDALHVTLPLKVQDLPELLGRYLAQYKKDTYKKEFPWVDQISEVKDAKLVFDLNDKLVKKIQGQDFTRLWLSIPEIVDWMAVEGFKYRDLDSAPEHEDVHIKDFVEEVKPRSGQFTLGFLKRNEVYAISADGSVYEDWLVYRCIYCEVDHENETFLLSNAIVAPALPHALYGCGPCKPSSGLLHIPVHILAPGSQTLVPTATLFKSHSIRRPSGFLQVAVSKAPRAHQHRPASSRWGASDTALRLLARTTSG